VHFLYLAASKSEMRVFFTIQGYLHWRETGRCYTALSMSKLSHDQSVLVSSPPIWGSPRPPDSCYCETFAGFLMWGGSVWQERMGLSFTVGAGSRQRSHSRGPSPTGLVTIILLSHTRGSPNLKDQVPIFISPGTGWPSYIPPCSGFPFHRLLRLAGLRWRYTHPPPRAFCTGYKSSPYLTGNTLCHLATRCCLLVAFCIQGVKFLWD
jgi:hypothetical protein